MKNSKRRPTALLWSVLPLLALDCGGAEEEFAEVSIHNNFDNPAMDFLPPWTLCETSYLGVEFGRIGIGVTSAFKQVEPGLDFVLMVAAWDDPSCAAEHCLPVASKNEEEIVAGQKRTLAINLPNHQGACPPEGVQPIPKAQYDRILALWPEYNFKNYDQRTENNQCTE